MIPALRLTTILLWLPAANVLALQGPPPATPPRPPREPRLVEPRPEPRIVEPRRIEPRVVEPRLAEPRLIEPRWIEPRFELDNPKFHFGPDFHFELSKMELLEPKMAMEMDMKTTMAMEMFDAKRFEVEASMHEFDAKRFELDARMADLSWKSDLSHLAPIGDGEWKREPFRTSPRAPWLQGDVADSLYKAAYELLNRGEWRRAATAFANLPQRFPNSGYVADAMYWQAFALYRIGGTEDLQTALRSLETMRTKYPQAKTQSDAATLSARIRGALASRGDKDAERQLRATMT